MNVKNSIYECEYFYPQNIAETAHSMLGVHYVRKLYTQKIVPLTKLGKDQFLSIIYMYMFYGLDFSPLAKSPFIISLFAK